MKTALIGYTGFVGSNIVKNMSFTDYYNSKNIQDILGKEYDFVISAGIRAEKYLANRCPERDWAEIQKFFETLNMAKRIKKLVLISTIDVYQNPVNVDEDTIIEEENLHSYGKHRYLVEKYVKEKFENFLIVRLPGLVGTNLKKNFIYDMMTRIPNIIMKEKFEKILKETGEQNRKKLNTYYHKDIDGNYRFTGEKSKELVKFFESINFTSLVFTDSRSSFQFYHLNHLVKDIQIALEYNIKVLNISTEPVTAREVAKECFDYNFVHEIKGETIPRYNVKSKYFQLYNGEEGYLYRKKEVLEEIKKFVKYREKL
ncbi:NAD(P)-dependent oxidoreductase [Fusobacterium necrophorum]|uniref:hypothetical protein n=1 Tax=Fusobacterium necrophorum TaxID=859 RepID=UPI000886F404|nr:hypothetical protein [Fusobacterium necrophorum]AYZ73055.1 NAD(P)-dependent oxidoreductase [Fusobacterium necrophorum]AZW08947.1 NAD(P)-dependent oxidoreductase [Fusobacterium necrophorum subsp. necrophorum]SDB39981.1 hypothetical protein SAMN02983009_01921 [Fusobacterium necrophorum]SQD09932.1 Uncharacterised protein [Fusobacterium necrophorum subsp. necrophorum]